MEEIGGWMREKISPNSLRSDGGQSPKNVRVQQGGLVSEIGRGNEDRGRVMASGWGITGNKGRCYDFWMDFSECMSRCREPKDCSLLREDYLECLHHSKEVISIPQLLVFFTPLSPSSLIVLLFQRRNRIYKEEQRQLRAAARKGKEGGNVDGHSH
ncbi:hypothetical protein RHMOL_Rhmol13G0204900 [Rhododendron molle]|uniref:Uncharacterized protein n=2 Tax=Rhododendron molle TaxID=49168 RepID=A0ACC0L993_RHOML|nr:hypothetical protein RHMOL_Rhmol13G0204900 [Rhododendron molle]KAI8525128.1 hypothetical protein RHMOL_Rhmol13G0204900 [Rhododendron molle]